MYVRIYNITTSCRIFLFTPTHRVRAQGRAESHRSAERLAFKSPFTKFNRRRNNNNIMLNNYYNIGFFFIKYKYTRRAAGRPDIAYSVRSGTNGFYRSRFKRVQKPRIYKSLQTYSEWSARFNHTRSGHINVLPGQEINTISNTLPKRHFSESSW